MPRALRFEIKPLTASIWPDFERLFGARGACAGCWCMFFRLGHKEWTAGQGAGNRRRMRALVARGAPPGLIAFAGSDPIGWCAVGPRDVYPRLARSRVLAPGDETQVWSVTCFFVAKEARGRGVTVALLRAAAQFAARRGARVLEGYPIDTSTRDEGNTRAGLGSRRIPDAFAYHGLATAFERAGFVEVARRSATRPILRCQLGRVRRGSKPASKAKGRRRFIAGT